MTVRVLDENDVRRLLPMPACIELMADVLAGLARDDLYNPLRFVVRPPGEPSLMGLMPAHRRGRDAALVAEGADDRPRQQRTRPRFASGIRGALRRQRPASRRAILNAGGITAIRTAAVSAARDAAPRARGLDDARDPRHRDAGAFTSGGHARRPPFRPRVSSGARAGGRSTAPRASPPPRRPSGMQTWSAR